MNVLPRAALLASALAATAFASIAGAAESNADVETEHFDGGDDGGPRSLALFARTAHSAVGLGAELSVAIGPNYAFAVSAEYGPFDAARFAGAAASIQWFPQRFAFHGLVVQAEVQWARAPATAASDQIGSVAVLVGYEWTSEWGPSVRIGGGPAYSMAVSGLLSSGSLGVHPEYDVAIGWIF